MTTLKIGEPAPDFRLPADNGTTVSLADFRGKKVILYFYPKDDTPGCTSQACGFRDAYPQIEEKNAVVIGVSPDSVKSHQKFKTKYDLPFLLVADEDHQLAEAYGVWGEKSMYGKRYFGIERTTFLINQTGKIIAVWRKVKVKNHVQEIIEKIEAIPEIN